MAGWLGYLLSSDVRYYDHSNESLKRVIYFCEWPPHASEDGPPLAALLNLFHDENSHI